MTPSYCPVRLTVGIIPPLDNSQVVLIGHRLCCGTLDRFEPFSVYIMRGYIKSIFFHAFSAINLPNNWVEQLQTFRLIGIMRIIWTVLWPLNNLLPFRGLYWKFCTFKITFWCLNWSTMLILTFPEVACIYSSLFHMIINIKCIFCKVSCGCR